MEDSWKDPGFSSMYIRVLSNGFNTWLHKQILKTFFVCFLIAASRARLASKFAKSAKLNKHFFAKFQHGRQKHKIWYWFWIRIEMIKNFYYCVQKFRACTFLWMSLFDIFYGYENSVSPQAVQPNDLEIIIWEMILYDCLYCDNCQNHVKVLTTESIFFEPAPQVKALVRNLTAFTTLFAPGKSWDNCVSLLRLIQNPGLHAQLQMSA